VIDRIYVENGVGRCVVQHWDLIEQLLGEPGPQAAKLLLSKATVETFS
jgi:hypothetical protein